MLLMKMVLEKHVMIMDLVCMAPSMANYHDQHCLIDLNICSNWLRDLKLFATAFCFVMAEREPAPVEDIRQRGFPCYSKHKPGKTRTNQYASWSACAQCGIRLNYVSKGSAHGQDRQAMPDAHLLRATMESLQATMEPQNCTERIVNGKLMELKGQMIQAGITPTMSIHMTYAEYHDKLRKAELVPTTTTAAYPKQSTAAPPKSPPMTPPTDHVMDETAEMRAQNAELQERLRVAELAVQQANHAAAEAMMRTEVLAQESMKQKEETSKQNAEMEELKKAASKAAPPIPNGHLPKASAPMPSKMENAATVPVISDDESNDPKKRTRAEASGKPGSAASGAA